MTRIADTIHDAEMSGSHWTLQGGPARVAVRRFRRFQALHDTLEIYFHIPIATWIDGETLSYLMEWDWNPTTQKRICRLCAALVRVGRIERKGARYVGYTYRRFPETEDE